MSYIVGFPPVMIQPLNKSIFDNANKIRKAWVMVVKGTMLEIKLQSYIREERFDLYRELDKEIMETWANLMREYNDYHHAQGHDSGQVIVGHRVLKKEFQVDTDDFLLQAVELVVNDWAKEFNA